jgi:hypothetical protein
MPRSCRGGARRGAGRCVVVDEIPLVDNSSMPLICRLPRGADTLAQRTARCLCSILGKRQLPGQTAPAGTRDASYLGKPRQRPHSAPVAWGDQLARSAAPRARTKRGAATAIPSLDATGLPSELLRAYAASWANASYLGKPPQRTPATPVTWANRPSGRTTPIALENRHPAPPPRRFEPRVSRTCAD